MAITRTADGEVIESALTLATSAHADITFMSRAAHGTIFSESGWIIDYGVDKGGARLEVKCGGKPVLKAAREGADGKWTVLEKDVNIRSNELAELARQSRSWKPLGLRRR